MFTRNCARQRLLTGTAITLRPTTKSFLYRPFSSTTPANSQIGRTPIILPPSVKLTINNPPPPKFKTRTEPLRTLDIEGPLGSLSLSLPPYLSIVVDLNSKKATISILDPKNRKQREMWGTIRALIQCHVLGVSEGHTAILRLNGVGYRAIMEQDGKVVSLKVGYSHPVELHVPKGVKASTPQPTRILLEGADKELVNRFAAQIRDWRKPEPYKGKGIFVNGETIKLKAKKVK